MSVLIVDVPGLIRHARRHLAFLPEDTADRLVTRLVPFWEAEVARRTGPTYYLPLEEDFTQALEAIYLNTTENLIILTEPENLAAVSAALDLYTPAPDLFAVERWTSAAAKRVCGMDPRWYREYLALEGDEHSRKLLARKLYKESGERWRFLTKPRSGELSISIYAHKAPNRLLNVEGAVYTAVVTEDELDAVVEQIEITKSFAFDTETTGLHPMDAELVGISIACAPGRAYYIPLGHRQGEQLGREYVMARLRPLFEDPEIKKYGHKLYFDINFVELHSNIAIEGIAGDSKTLAWMLGYGSTLSATREQDGEKLGLKSLAYAKLGIRMMSFDSATAGREDASDTPIDKMTPYAAADADMTLRLVQGPLLRELRESSPTMWKRYFEIELPFLRTVANMERRGVYINTQKTQQLSNEFALERLELEERLKAVTRDESFNPGSPRAVGKALFDTFGLPPIGGRTKTGFKTDAATLEALKHMHPVVEMILEHKAITKLMGTYTDALPAFVSPRTGRVHGLISSTGTATGRVAMSKPNLMNIPVRTERGAKLRYVIEGQDDNELLQVDYSQIEPRVMAHMSEDPFLIDIFQAGIDLYRAIGGEFFGKQPDEITDNERKVMKMCWLAATYLVGAEKLSSQMTSQLHQRVTRGEAQDFLDRFDRVLSRVKEWRNDSLAFARRHGYVETLLGFRIPVPGMNSPVPDIRAHAHSQAVNLPIQGSASGDIMKLAMNALDLVGDAVPPMILQVHDELIFEGPRHELEEKLPVVRTLLENVIQLKVPLVAEPAIAKSWGEAKG